MARSPRKPAVLLGVCTGLALVVSACGGNSTEAPAPASSKAQSSQKLIDGLQTDQALHDRLPAHVKDSGELKSVTSGALPPYTVPAEGETSFVGASIDMKDALGKVLGVEVSIQPVEGLAGVLSGMASGRYDFAMGPIGDYPDRQADSDFLDWVKDFVAFLVPNGNPDDIESIDDTCGLKVAVQAGGSAEEVINEQSEKCTEDGHPAVEVQSFPDQPSGVLAVKSGRSDAFFTSQSIVTYYVAQDPGQLTPAAMNKPNGFDPIRQGAIFPKNSELLPVMTDAVQVLFENGTYEKIMKLWGLEGQILPEPTINLKPIEQ